MASRAHLIATAKNRTDRPRARCEILCRDPGHGRSAPCRGPIRGLLHEKFELAYPITPGLKALLEDGLTDSRWDMTYLTMQILIEGLALAACSRRIRDSGPEPAGGGGSTPMSCRTRRAMSPSAASPCATSTRSSAMPSARSGRISSSPRAWHMRDRFNQREVWERLGLPVEEMPADRRRVRDDEVLRWPHLQAASSRP